MIAILDSTIDVPMASSGGRVDTMPKKYTFDVIVVFFGMILSLPLELAIGTSMMLSDIVILVYHKVSELPKSLRTCISPVNSSKYCVK